MSLAANAPEYVRAIVLEDPPLFRCDAENIRTTAVYDTWLAFSRIAISGGGGYSRFFLHHLIPQARKAAEVMNSSMPPAPGLVKGPWTYVRMDCGHVIALEQPEVEAQEILRWYAEQVGAAA
ncbi:hypothetical protein BH09ACT12_BH09ACT12_07430 [soil metagenome]